MTPPPDPPTLPAASTPPTAPARPALGTLSAPAAADVPEVLRACHARALEREGIAMFVSLHDTRPGRVPLDVEERSRADGARLAELLDHYYAGLEAIGFPPQFDEPDETGAPELIDALVALSDQHLRARVEPQP